MQSHGNKRTPEGTFHTLFWFCSIHLPVIINRGRDLGGQIDVTGVGRVELKGG